MSTLAHLGKLTFGEEAAMLWNSEAERVSQPSNVAVLEAVAKGTAESGIIPIQNSIEGDVVEVMDHLMQAQDLWVVGEVLLPINQCLFVPRGLSMEQVEVIFSHPQALGQCRRNIARVLPHAMSREVNATADGIPAMLKHGLGAAIAPRIAVRPGAELVREHFEDYSSNVTKFLVVSRQNHRPSTGNDRTFVVFVLPDRPGSLVHAIMSFYLCGINMSKITSRPAKDSFGKYIFWIELEAHQEDERTKEALALMQRHTDRMRVLGSCPRAS